MAIRLNRQIWNEIAARDQARWNALSPQATGASATAQTSMQQFLQRFAEQRSTEAGTPGPNPAGGQVGSRSGPLGQEIARGIFGLSPLGPAGTAISLVGNLARSLDDPTQLGTMAQNIDINPAAYGSDLAPGDLSRAAATIGNAINATQNQRGLSIDPNADLGADSGGIGLGGGLDSGGGTSGTAGGEHAAEKEAATGDSSGGDGGGDSGGDGGGEAKGGVIPGPRPANPNRDNTVTSAQGGEVVMNEELSDLMGRDHLMELNELARKGATTAQLKRTLRSIAADL